MRAPIRSAVIVSLATALGCSAGAWAQTLDEICTDEMELGACFDALRDAFSKDTVERLEEKRETTKEAVKDSRSALLSSDSSAGTASSAWDTLSQLFGALGLGATERTDDSLTLNFNTDALWNAANPLTLQVVARKALLFDEVVKAQTEGARADFREAFEGELGDFDDVEFLVAWSRSPRNEQLQQEALSTVVNGVYDAAWTEAGRMSAGEWVDALQSLQDSIATRLEAARVAGGDAAAKAARAFAEVELADLSMGEVRQLAVDVGLGQELEAKLIRHAKESAERFDTYSERFNPRDGDLFLKLAANEPQFRLALSGRSRTDLVGPDEYKGSLTWERGAYSLSRARKECEGAALDEALCLIGYQRQHAEEIRRSARLSFSLEYGRTSAFEFRRDPWNPLRLESADSTAATLAYGRNLRDDATTKAVTLRFDFEAKYENVTGDPNRNNRFIATATLAQALTGGANASISLVYANRPEYRGTVDQELSARAGLKWTTDRKSTGAE